MVSFTIYFAVSLVAQNKGTNFTYPVGIEMCNPTSWSLSSFYIGVKSVPEGILARLTHMLI